MNTESWIGPALGTMVWRELGQDRQRCLDRLLWAMQSLQVTVDPNRLLKIADLIVQTMTGPSRHFHSPEHSFQVGGREDPIEILAALFHDLVYTQVDRTINLNLCTYIIPFVRELRGNLLIREAEDLPEDSAFELVRILFGMIPGQVLSPTMGQNEFLSALITAKVLEPFLNLTQLAQVIACIEATIPFRTPSEFGLTPSDRLYLRLSQANQQFELGLSEAELIQAIQRSVRMSNRDVENFADPSPARFLDNTWTLLPETNHELKSPNTYTVRQYRLALQKMETLMNGLKPELVFQQFQGVPDDATYLDLVARAKRNIEISRLYLGTKLVAIAILEGLSLRLGHHVPLATLLGELPSLEFAVTQWEDALPEVGQPQQPQSELEQEVLDLLEQGRTQHSFYDTRRSPLSTLMVKLIGFSEIRRLLVQSKAFFQGTLSASHFLSSCPSQIVLITAHAISQSLESRRAALLRHP